MSNRKKAQRNQAARTERAARREMKKINLKLAGYLQAFMSICYFQEEKLDWNAITELEFKRLNGVWKAHCRQKGYSGEIMGAFKWNAWLLKTDLILQVKYQAEADREELYELLKKGMEPLELADYAKKKLIIKLL